MQLHSAGGAVRCAVPISSKQYSIIIVAVNIITSIIIIIIITITVHLTQTYCFFTCAKGTSNTDKIPINYICPVTIRVAIKLPGNVFRRSSSVLLVEALYTDTCRLGCVYADVLYDWFVLGSGVWQGCRMAPDLFLGPMDHMMERTAHQGMAGVTLGNEVFTDLDFADDGRCFSSFCANTRSSACR